MSGRRLSQLGWVGGLLLSAYAYVSYRLDEYQLHNAASRCVAARSSAAEKTLALLTWVHEIPQTAENRRYFLLPRLRATPRQVLESGGDCADKSRLLTALLRQVDVPSTMVMCFDPRTQAPTHTVVCATMEDGSTMVVDPAYGLFFPDEATGRYLGLAELRRDPSHLDARLRELRAQIGRHDPIQVYNASTAGYSMASSINWNKNALTQAVHDLLLPGWGEALYAAGRPRLLEEPKLLVACLGLALSLALLIVHAVIHRLRRLAGACVPNTLIQSSQKSLAWKAVGT